MNEDIKTPSPVSSQPVTEPVKGEEAEIPDFYAGWLNTERIKEYRWLAKRFTCDEGTVRDLFCHGIDFAVNQFKALTSVQSVLSVQSGKGEALTPLLPNEKGEDNSEINALFELLLLSSAHEGSELHDFYHHIKSQGFKIVKENI